MIKGLTPEEYDSFAADVRNKGFDLGPLIGRGGMGSVYEARQHLLNRKVAVKILHSYSAEDKESQNRFINEMSTMAALNHPGIVDIYSGDISSQGIPYFVMEYVDGPSLASHIRQRGRFSIHDTCRILEPIAQALDYIHRPSGQRQAIAHRDVKPDNILMASNGAKLTDFGISLTGTSTRYTSEGLVIGTQDYLAPELYHSYWYQNSGLNTLFSADLYAFSLVAFEMVTGTPFASHFPDKRAWAGSRYFPFQNIQAGLVFARALSNDPGERYPTAMSFLRALYEGSRAPVQLNRPAPHPAPKATPKASRPRPRNSKIWTILALTSITLAVVVVATLLMVLPWRGADVEIAEAFPEIIPSTVGRGAFDTFCQAAKPEPGQLAKIKCSSDSLTLAIADYGTREARDKNTFAPNLSIESQGGCEIEVGTIGYIENVTLILRPLGRNDRFAFLVTGPNAEQISPQLQVC